MRDLILLAALWVFALGVAVSSSFAAEKTSWKAGLAKTRITPDKSLWMGGFGARTNTSSGTLQELYAKALALDDGSGRPAVLVTTDLVGFRSAGAKNIAERVEKQHGLPRARLILNSSHTHCGPLLADPLSIWYRWRLSDQQYRDVEEYTRELEGKVVAVIGAALRALQPARLSFGQTEATFAVNRRLKTETGFASFVPNPQGPVDHDVPFLRVESEEGQLRGIVLGYGCHNTTLLANTYQFNGDYAGFAQAWLEQQHPDAPAFFVQGCGGDIMVSPRGTVELARKYGEILAGAVNQAMGGSLRPVRGPLKCAFEVFPVAFAPAPSREELEARLQGKSDSDARRHALEFLRISEADWRRHAQELLKILDGGGGLPTEYPYPLQVWQFGADLTLVALAGEPVVDYALRLKKEFGADKLWVAGYCNDVFAYIPSLRVLQEGGYEGGGAIVGARLPGPFAPNIEETIVRQVHELVGRVRAK